MKKKCGRFLEIAIQGTRLEEKLISSTWGGDTIYFLERLFCRFSVLLLDPRIQSK